MLEKFLERLKNFAYPVLGKCPCGGDIREHLDWIGPYHECDRCRKIIRED